MSEGVREALYEYASLGCHGGGAERHWVSPETEKRRRGVPGLIGRAGSLCKGWGGRRACQQALPLRVTAAFPRRQVREGEGKRKDQKRSIEQLPELGALKPLLPHSPRLP